MRKLLLLLRTARYLRTRQIAYRVLYSLKPAKPLAFYEKPRTSFSFLKFTLHYTTPEYYKGNKNFEFLNQEHTFQDNIDWNFGEYGKLWNYNLQYFNFLQQENISNDLKNNWLKDISKWLYAGKISLEPYTVSLRVLSSIRYLSFAQNDDEVIINSLYAQLNYLYHHPEYHLSGNHLLENAFALLMGAEAFTERTWRLKAKSILISELKEQVLQDGAHFEQSVMYHQAITFRLIELIDWYKNTEQIDPFFLQFLETTTTKMLDWLKIITFKNGDIPLLNDSANGIAFTSAQLFAFAAALKLPGAKPVTLTDCGYRKYASGSYECIVDAGGMTATYQPGHSHADALSFILHYKNLPVIVDTGISTYEAGERRIYERSTAAHNTVVINDTDQSDVWSAFRVGRRAQVNIIDETPSGLSAFHDGYKHFKIIHSRSFSFTREAITIFDVIQNSKKTTAKFYLHFHPDCSIYEQNGKILVNGLAISFTGAKSINLETYKFAAGFNILKDAKVAIAEFHNSLETSITL